MSGGHFAYNRYKIEEMADDLDEAIAANDGAEGYGLSNETILELRKALALLRLSFVYVHSIDRLLSCDDGENTFHKRLKEEVDRLVEAGAISLSLRQFAHSQWAESAFVKPKETSDGN